MPSTMMGNESSNDTPNGSYSPRSKPRPAAKTTRPPLKASNVAHCSATLSG